jgi:hypothetical protein
MPQGMDLKMKYLLKNKDGTISILSTTSDEFTCEGEILKMSKDVQSKIESHRHLDESEIPQDLSEQHLWRHKDDKIVIVKE